MKNMSKEKLVNVSAKVPVKIKQDIVKQAQKEQRTVSQVVARLLSSHPALNQTQQV